MVVGLYFQTSVSTIKCLKSLLCPLASKLLLSLVILAKGREGPRGRIQVADSCLAAVSSTVKSFTFSISSPAGSLLFLLACIRHMTSSFSLTTSIFLQNICLANWCHAHTFARIHSTQMAASSQAPTSPQIPSVLYPQAVVAPALQSVHPSCSSADTHGKPDFSEGKGKVLIQLNAGAGGRCLWRPAVRAGLAADWAELSSLPPVYFFKWQRAPLYILVRLVRLMSGNDSYWFDRLPHAHRSTLSTESCLITTERDEEFMGT